MSKKAKICIILSICLVMIGGIIFTGVMATLKWDFSKLSIDKYETNTYEITENFAKMLITTIEGNIEIVPATDGRCKVVCYEKKKVKHEVKVESDHLIIDAQDSRRWYDYINFFSFDTPKITVYLPTDMIKSLYINGSTGNINISSDFTFEEIDIVASTGSVNCYASATGDIKITLSTGSIDLTGVCADSLNLSTSTGKIKVKMATCSGDISATVTTGYAIIMATDCKSLYSTGNTGDIKIVGVTATENFNIERSTGDIEFENSDANEIYAKTSTGDIEGTLLSDKIFFTETSTGEVDVPRSTTGGRCELTTSTGDIEIEISRIAR